MAQPESPVIVLEQTQVAPPPGFKPQPSPPVTFFDVFWLALPPVERLFFYSYHHSTSHFMNTTLPSIKHSLSLTLQHFYPLACTLTWPLNSSKPIFNYSEDDSAVTLTIAESRLGFVDLVGYHARDVNEFFPLVPQIPPPNTEVEVQVPVMALQVTLFPNTGICIGISTLHVIGDGKTTTHFMKSWASVCKSGLGDTSCLRPESLPFYDRTVISDPKDLVMVYTKEIAGFNISQQCFYIPKIPTVEVDKVRATFVLGRPEILKIRTWVQSRFEDMYNKDSRTLPPLQLSAFVVTCAYVWTCLIKVLASDQDADSTEPEIFSFPVDCRERLSPPIPATYFGNCLMACFVEVKRNELIREEGVAIAAEAIGSAIQKMISEGVLAGAEDLFNNYKYLLSKPRVLSIAGSPRLGVYGADFGWGRPKKVEVVSIDTTFPTGIGSMSLSDCQDGKEGTEIGLVLNKLQMDAFASLFTATLQMIS